MSKIFNIASGSKGNCTYVSNGDDAILIDAGVSCARITSALREKNFDVEKVRAIFVTHEHTDHINGIKVFASKFNLPVYMTKGTLESLGDTPFDDRVDVRVMDGAIDCGNICESNFHTSHDAAESCGYVLETPQEIIAVCTDLGVVTEEVHNAISGARAIVIESNHDLNLLRQNPNYTLQLKRRIMSDCGHLSNVDCAEEMVQLIKEGTVHFVLAHLSEQNNTPTVALGAAKTRLLIEGMKLERDYTVMAAMPKNNRVITI